MFRTRGFIFWKTVVRTGMVKSVDSLYHAM